MSWPFGFIGWAHDTFNLVAPSTSTRGAKTPAGPTYNNHILPRSTPSHRSSRLERTRCALNWDFNLNFSAPHALCSELSSKTCWWFGSLNYLRCSTEYQELPPTKEVHVFARVCLSVCLSVSKITQKRVHGFRRNVACRQVSGHGRTD